jgi:hypothetical protein
MTATRLIARGIVVVAAIEPITGQHTRRNSRRKELRKRSQKKLHFNGAVFPPRDQTDRSVCQKLQELELGYIKRQLQRPRIGSLL